MHLDLLRNYLAHHAMSDDTAAGAAVSRRTALTLGAAAAGTIAALAGSERAAAGGTTGWPTDRETFGDDFFDYGDPANLPDWVPSVYGAGDQRGAFSEVTAAKTAAALKLFNAGRAGAASRRSSSAS